MILFDETTRKKLIDLYQNKNIYLEGNIIKLIDGSTDEEFQNYLDICLTNDKDRRRKRLDITKEFQIQNTKLTQLNIENEKMMVEVKDTLKSVEESKNQIEVQNKELILWKEENQRISEELVEQMKKSESARVDAENAKKNVENDLDVLQKKTQFEMINTIVKSALYIIIGVGISTTLLFIFAIMKNKETQLIGSTWSNMFGILLTNSFSVVGTIMGVKYASGKSELV